MEFIDPTLESKIPPPGSSRQAVGVLREELRQRWGLRKSPLVSAGGGDNMMGAIGTGNVESGVVTTSLGTSGTVYAYSAEPVVDPVGEVAAFCDSTDQWLPLICTMNVTVATEQVRGLFGWDIVQLNQAAADTPAGAGGVIFLPYLSGERTPNLPHGSGVFHGLNASNMTPNAMARAAMEGATLGLAYGLNRLRSLKIKPTEIRLTGGGSKSQVWRQICADVFGVHVVCLATAEGAALGAALHSAWVDGLVNNTRSSLTDLIQQAVKLNESSRTEPVARSSELYQGIYSRFEGLTKSLAAAGFL